MEVENMHTTNNKEEDDDVAVLPGFRFHPTDEELVGFYLRRKVEKKPTRIELIKQADIYKYDPWDLPKSSKGGEREWYFFCRRGRKYKNSIRPNRVTASGFWKATGIDRPIYSSSRECIGLKKSLVYYRGSAGKGTKTEWMMHEFRLPPTPTKTTKHNTDATSTNTTTQEAEVWTLCRILKRNVSYRKSSICVGADWRDVGNNKRDKIMNINNPAIFDARSETCSTVESCGTDHDQIKGEHKSYICFTSDNRVGDVNQGYFSSSSSVISQAAPSSSALSSYINGDINEFLRHADWEDLRSVMDYAHVTDSTNPCLYM